MKNLQKQLIKRNLLIAGFSLFIFLFPGSPDAVSQTGNIEEVKILTSADCSSCKEKIEKMLTFERGVRKALLDLETKIVTVHYNVRRTDPKKLEEAISALGYDTEILDDDSDTHLNTPE